MRRAIYRDAPPELVAKFSLCGDKERSLAISFNMAKRFVKPCFRFPHLCTWYSAWHLSLFDCFSNPGSTCWSLGVWTKTLLRLKWRNATGHGWRTFELTAMWQWESYFGNVFYLKQMTQMVQLQNDLFRCIPFVLSGDDLSAWKDLWQREWSSTIHPRAYPWNLGRLWTCVKNNVPWIYTEISCSLGHQFQLESHMKKYWS